MDEWTQRIEEIEALAYADPGQAARGLEPLSLQQLSTNGALISVASGDPHFLINRVIGLGINEAAKDRAFLSQTQHQGHVLHRLAGRAFSQIIQ